MTLYWVVIGVFGSENWDTTASKCYDCFYVIVDIAYVWDSLQKLHLITDIYQEAGLPLWLRPYEVIVTSAYTALIETIPDTVLCNLSMCSASLHFVRSVWLYLSFYISLQASIHSIKSRFPNISNLRDYYVAKYEENSPNFKLAQVSCIFRHSWLMLISQPPRQEMAPDEVPLMCRLMHLYCVWKRVTCFFSNHQHENCCPLLKHDICVCGHCMSW